MDPRNGEVLALGSYPSFDANVFAKPLSQRKYDELNSEENGAPLFNRAIAATYPTGSTFKLVTAMAALQEGLITPSSTIVDSGVFKLGDREFKNAKDAVFGALQLRRGADGLLRRLLLRARRAGQRARARSSRTWARRLGIGRRTGIDMPGEFAGLVPDARVARQGLRRVPSSAPRRPRSRPARSEALYACGGIERPWSQGDNVNLAVGQGDLQATPLQLATAYSTIANGGRVVRPHLGQAVEDGDGPPGAADPQARAPQASSSPRPTAQAIMEGLRGAASADGGTSTDVFKGFPYPVYGKTGTAERAPNPDQSWYAAYVPHPTRPIVVVTTIEKGGFGAETAGTRGAPDPLRVVPSSGHDFHAGSSQTR